MEAAHPHHFSFPRHFFSPAKRASKVESERLLWHFMEQQKNDLRFSAVSINPSLIMGPLVGIVENKHDLSLSCSIVHDLLTGGYNVVPAGGNAWVDVEDVGKLLK